MSEAGQCWDNARPELFFARLKYELEVEVFAICDQGRAVPFDSLEVFYSSVRRHSSLAWLSPGSI